jgi:hypothetical protein
MLSYILISLAAATAPAILVGTSGRIATGISDKQLNQHQQFETTRMRFDKPRGIHGRPLASPDTQDGNGKFILVGPQGGALVAVGGADKSNFLEKDAMVDINRRFYDSKVLLVGPSGQIASGIDDGLNCPFLEKNRFEATSKPFDRHRENMGRPLASQCTQWGSEQSIHAGPWGGLPADANRDEYMDLNRRDGEGDDDEDDD